MFDMLTIEGGWMFYAAAGLGIAFFALAMLFSMGFVRNGLTIWHGILFGAIAYFVAVMIHGYLGLFDWILAGMLFEDIGATVFLFGLILMQAVMAYNLIATKGRTMVR